MVGDTPESVCTLAMTYLGADEVQELETPETQEEVICARIYPNLKQSILSMYPWRFAMKTQQLSRDVAVPPVHWSYQYTLPTDRLKNEPYRLYPSEQAGDNTIRDYETVGDKLFTNQPTLFMQYNYSAAESEWPPYFVEFVAHALAARAAIPVTGDTQLQQTYTLLAFGPEGTGGALFRTAKKRDADDRPSRIVQDNAFIDARFGPVW